MSAVSRNAPRGYILVETIVAMAVLSLSMVGIHQSVRGALITRAMSEDYTTARFLLERVMADVTMQPELTQGSGSGVFNDYPEFSFQWKIDQVAVPRPELYPEIDPAIRANLEKQFKGFMPHVYVKITWRRGGQAREAVGETLLAPEQLWLPPEQPVI